MRVAPLALALALAPLAVRADPIPVHVAAPRTLGRGAVPSAAERLAVGDVVAQVLGAAAREVLSATETRARVEALNPAGLGCDALDCITAITLPLHARALVMVREARQRDGLVRVEVRLVNLRGEVLAERAEQDLATTTAEAVALARLTAGSLVDALRALEAPAPQAVVRVPEVAPAPASAAPPSPAPAPPERRRRMGELAGGVAAVLAGVAAISVGAAGLGADERVTRDLGENRVEVERPSSLNWVWVGAGVAAVGVGAFLVADGARLRTASPRATAWLTPTPGGAAAVVGGSF